jgi:hypothetical protein
MPDASVASLAALVGWSDPRVKRLASRVSRLETMFPRYLRHYLEEKQHSLPEPGQIIELENEDLRVVEGKCNAALDDLPKAREKAAADGCAILVETRPHQPTRSGAGSLSMSLEMVWPDGRRLKASRFQAKRSRGAEGWVRQYVMPMEAYHRQEEGPILLMRSLDSTVVRLR